MGADAPGGRRGATPCVLVSLNCEQLTPSDGTAERGTAIGAGSCDPNPCVSSPSGAFLN